MKVVLLLVVAYLITADASVMPPSLSDVRRLAVGNMPTWEKVATEDGEFSIFMPGEPRLLPVPSEWLKGQVYAVPLPGMVFIVEGIDTP